MQQHGDTLATYSKHSSNHTN